MTDIAEIDNFVKDCKLFKPDCGDLPFSAYALGKKCRANNPGVRSNGPHEFGGYEGEHI